MQNNNSLIYWVVALLGVSIVAALGLKTKQTPTPPPQKEIRLEKPPEPPKLPAVPKITEKIPAYLDYQQTIAQIKKWNQEAPDFTEVGTYGKSKRGTDLYFIKITNKIHQAPKPKVLITGCIHGNEPWASGCVMAYIGTLLGDYGTNKEVTELVNTREIYVIPVVSPDSYPNSRHVDGVDPNRDFPGPSRPGHRSTPSIQAVQDFFNKIKPNAVISGHTHGRIFLTPYGDKTQLCPNDADYKRIVGEMARLSNYKLDRACNMYGRPIYGSEVDWYYRNGALSIVMEFGTHQRKPTHEEIKSETQRTWAGVVLFIREAPLVKLTEGFDFSGNTGISRRRR